MNVECFTAGEIYKLRRIVDGHFFPIQMLLPLFVFKYYVRFVGFKLFAW